MDSGIEKKNLFYRSFELERDTLSEEKREVQLSFSSETPVMRWFGAEILLHGEKNVNLNRIKISGSLIFGHRPGELKNILGPIKNVWLDTKRRVCRALVGFDDDEGGEKALQKTKSGSLRGVSCGYNIKKARRLKDGEDWEDPDSRRKFKGPAMIAMLWEPVEISLTPVPADVTVGISRAATRSLEGIELIDFETDEGLLRDDISQIANCLSFSRSVDNKGRLSLEKIEELTSRAAAVSDELFREVSAAALAGKSEEELEGLILSSLRKNPDAYDSPGAGNMGEGRRGTIIYSSLKDIPDDVFKNSFKIS